ncbi:hypothetical protein NKG94_50385 [Micromonospora sp. M12]
MVAAAIGLLNGLLVAKLQINAFIATVGVGLLLKGYLDNGYDGPAGKTAPRSCKASATSASGRFRSRSCCCWRWPPRPGSRYAAPGGATTSSPSAATPKWPGSPVSATAGS